MKIIVGLGNPGDKYKNTRHNAGFLFLDFFADEYNFPEFSIESKFRSLITQQNIGGEKIILVKPLTYMNLSGEALQLVMQYYKLNNEDFTVIFDDISMNFGKIRQRSKGSAGGQNGIKSIIKHRGEDFHRVKIGIGCDNRYELSDWVLSKFSQQEIETLNIDIFPEVLKIVDDFILGN